MILVMTPEEKTAYEAVQNLKAAYQMRLDDRKNLDPRPTLEQIREENTAYTDQMKELEKSIEFQRAFLKAEFNNALKEGLAKAGPLGDPAVHMPVLQEIVGEALYGVTVQEYGELVKAIVVRFIEVLSNKEVATASAASKFQRWDLLKAAGFPADVATQIVVAESGRPWPAITFPSSKKDK